MECGIAFMGFVIAYHRQRYASQILAQWGKKWKKKKCWGGIKIIYHKPGENSKAKLWISQGYITMQKYINN